MDQHDTAYQSFGNIVVYVPEADLDKALGLLKELKH